jgi:DNA primase
LITLFILMIEQSVIEQIFDTAQIVDVVQDYVSLKKRGVNYLGLCPFHSEKTPSFTVSPAKNIYKCFGCGKGGNPVSFVMEHDHLSYTEALRFLAKKYNIDIKESEATQEDILRHNEIESLGVVNEYASKYFTEQLHQTEEGRNIGLSYFHERGFRDDIIEKFQLGYSPEKSDEFSQTAIGNGYKKEFLVKTGLTIENERGLYDRFHGRAMFPIHSLSGKVIAFGGRTFRTDKNIAKYLNSPESELYHKSKVLYGIFHANKSVIKNDKCFLVEGYTDVISMHQAGIENVVASSGTSLTTEQIRLIKRFTSNITILYDGDAAGIKASLRGIDMILEEGMNVKVLLFPDNEDPDSFARSHSSTEVIDFISKNETDFVLFKTKLLMDDAQNDPIKRATLIQDIVSSVAHIPDAIVRSVYIKECSVILNTDEKIIYSHINKIRRDKAEQRYKTQWPVSEETTVTPATQLSYHNDTDNIERELIRFLLMYGDKIITFPGDNEGDVIETTIAAYIFFDLEHDELELIHPLYKQIFEEYQYFVKNDIPVTDKYFINHSDKEICNTVVDIFTQQDKYKESRLWKKNNSEAETETSKLKDVVLGLLLAYKEKALKKQLLAVQHDLMESNNDELKTEELIRLYMSLTSLKKNLSKTLGDRIII